ncbi:MAG: hypothetical protein KDJ47_02625 [Hyphomicrobiaceae bacterium]|nr:hypothetical protein [Hyphomicrobiaceae bacterium]
MSRHSIARMQRLMRLTNLMYEMEARAVAELKQQQAILRSNMEQASAFLDGDGVVSAVFPALVARRVDKLRRAHKAKGGELAERIRKAINARAGSLGVAARVEKELHSRRRSDAAATLEEVVDQVARKSMVRLR